MSNKHIVPIQQYADTEDYFIEIPQEICQELNWNEGDEIDWKINNQSIIITKVQDSTESTEEPTLSDYDWYTVKEEAIQDYYNSESEGKDFDQRYDQYIEETAKETFGQAYHSPEAQGHWN